MDSLREMAMGRSLVETMCGLFPGEVEEELKYRLQFRQRALLYTLQRNRLLKPQLARLGLGEKSAVCRSHSCLRTAVIIRSIRSFWLIMPKAYGKGKIRRFLVAQWKKNPERRGGPRRNWSAGWKSWFSVYRWRILYLRAKSMGQ